MLGRPRFYSPRRYCNPRAKGGARGSMLGSGSSVASPSVNKGWGDASSASGGGGGNSVDGDRSWYARSKVSKTVPLRTLMLDSEVRCKVDGEGGGECDQYSTCVCAVRSTTPPSRHDSNVLYE